MSKWGEIKDDPNLSDPAAALRDQAARRLGFEEPNRPGHEAPDVNLSDLPKVPTGPGPGQPVTPGMFQEDSYSSAIQDYTQKIYAEMRAEAYQIATELAERIEKVLALHDKVDRSGVVWCDTDDQEWPCETVKILTGETDGD